MGGLREAGDAVSSSFYLLGSLQHLPADRCEPAGSRQAINKSNVKCSLERGEPPADRRVVYVQTASSSGKCADLRHGEKMSDVFPIDHLCEISRIARIYTEFLHRPHGRISGRREGDRTPCRDSASELVSSAWSRAGAGPCVAIFRRCALSPRPSRSSASPTPAEPAPQRLLPRPGARE